MRNNIYYENPQPACVIGFGNIIAMILSWSINHSIFWLIIHGFFGWFYVIYYIFVH